MTDKIRAGYGGNTGEIREKYGRAPYYKRTIIAELLYYYCVL